MNPSIEAVPRDEVWTWATVDGIPHCTRYTRETVVAYADGHQMYCDRFF